MNKDPRRKNGYRRDQIRKRVLAAYTYCHLCGQPVDKTLPPGNPWSGEVDELIPVSKGGSPTDWNNVALAHRICNELRGNHSTSWARARLTQPKNQSEKTKQKKYLPARQKTNKTSL